MKKSVWIGKSSQHHWNQVGGLKSIPYSYLGGFILFLALFIGAPKAEAAEAVEVVATAGEAATAEPSVEPSVAPVVASQPSPIAEAVMAQGSEYGDVAADGSMHEQEAATQDVPLPLESSAEAKALYLEGVEAMTQWKFEVAELIFLAVMERYPGQKEAQDAAKRLAEIENWEGKHAQVVTQAQANTSNKERIEGTVGRGEAFGLGAGMGMLPGAIVGGGVASAKVLGAISSLTGFGSVIIVLASPLYIILGTAVGMVAGMASGGIIALIIKGSQEQAGKVAKRVGAIQGPFKVARVL